MLSGRARKLWLIANLALGVFPGMLFFAWVERNCSLPWFWVFEEVRWPWFNLSAESTGVLAAFNVGLFLTFGAVHSWTAQEGFQDALSRIVPRPATRTVYLILSGATLFVLMGLWQSTGVVLWALPTSPAINSVLSMVLFWSLLALCGKVAKLFDIRHFFGWRQLYEASPQSSGNERLETSGFYGWVRHPIYTLSFIAFVATPFMSLDRMLITLGMAIYLAFGIPLEERKLVRLFGEAYLRYRSRVPAVFPSLRHVVGSNLK